MKINSGNCTNCTLCIEDCPVGAIKTGHQTHYIDQDLCVECAVCLRSGSCLSDSIYQQPLEWPRILRSQFSDPLSVHPSTKIKGRGAAEVKTNDVSGRFKPNEVGFVIDMGRPGITVTFNDVEIIMVAIAGLVEFEANTPVSSLFNNETGRLDDECVRSERVMSAIITCKVQQRLGLDVLQRLEVAAKQIESVFSLGVINRCDGYNIPFLDVLQKAGYNPSINGKTNVGLGRPIA